MAHVGLDGLLREEESFADLAVDEAVRNQLQHLDLASCGILPDLARGRWGERDDCTPARRAATRSSRLEAAAVIAVPVEDLLALSSVHEFRIGAAKVPL